MPYKNREKLREYKEAEKKRLKRYYEKNKEWLKEKNKEYVKNNKDRYLLAGARKRAKDKSLPFDLELSDIVIPEFCPMLGIRLEVQEGHSSACSPTLDRIIPEKGYIKGNVQVISMRANQIKSDATADELMAVAKYCKEQQDG